METCQPGTSYSLDLSSMVGGQHGGLIAGYPQTGGGKGGCKRGGGRTTTHDNEPARPPPQKPHGTTNGTRVHTTPGAAQRHASTKARRQGAARTPAPGAAGTQGPAGVQSGCRLSRYSMAAQPSASECNPPSAARYRMEGWREVETWRMGRAALEGGLGRGSYVVGAQWDEGNMVHAMRR